MGERNNRYLALRGLFLSVSGGFVAAIVTLIAAFFFMGKIGFISAIDCGDYLKVYLCFVDNGSAWGDSAYLQMITNFYTTIITVLIAALALVAALGAYTLRASSRFQIEQDLPGAVSDFFERERSRELLSKVVVPSVEEKLASSLSSISMPTEGELAGAFSALQNRVDQLTVQVERLIEE